MSRLIGRRRLLFSFPALTLPFAFSKIASAQKSVAAELLINASDSLIQYKFLLEKVRGDAYQSAAAGAINALGVCNDHLTELRDVFSEIQQRLRGQAHWPQLEQRFNTLEQSLALVQDQRTGQVNEGALQALPATLEGLRLLMKDISSDCDVDPDGKISGLVDKIYSEIAQQNHDEDVVNTRRDEWNAWNNQIGELNDDCGDNMDKAAVAISDGVRGVEDWYQRAVASLQEALSALNGIRTIDAKMAAAAVSYQMVRLNNEASDAPATAIDSLACILDTTVRSLGSANIAGLRPVSWSLGSDDQVSTPVPSFPLGQNDAGLIAEVQGLVQQPRYFTPGSTTQTINCIAVCFPVWVVYSSNSDSDVRTRTALIESALYFGLVAGVQRGVWNELAGKLQGIYSERKQELGV